jgi:hypothetical protein
MKKLLLLFISAALILLSCDYPEPQKTFHDSISIIEVTPNKDFVYGVSTDFTIKIKYKLLSQEQGKIYFYFNDGTSSDKMIHRGSVFYVDKGSREQIFLVTATPKDWEDSKFKVMVIMNLITSDNVGLAYDEKSF